jgi:phosphoribosylformylglycinamidine cyclo-ligase
VFEQVGRKQIHGMVHCSGGAQTKILHFIENLHIIKDALFEVPPLFELIQKESGTSTREMYQVFNMGHRMELYVDPVVANQIIEVSSSFNVEAKIIGRVEGSVEKKLTLQTPEETFVYP